MIWAAKLSAPHLVGESPQTNDIGMVSSQRMFQIILWLSDFVNAASCSHPLFQHGALGQSLPAAHERSSAKLQPSEEHTHLRFRIVVWTCLEAVQDAVGQDYIIMWRQKASDVVFPDDMETIRRDLEEGCRQPQGIHYQIVLRELQTLSGHPDRLRERMMYAQALAAIEMAPSTRKPNLGP